MHAALTTARDVVTYAVGWTFFVCLAAVNAAREQAANYRRWPGL